jgi:hypothetical protein
MSVAVVVPYNPGQEDRDVIWSWMRERWAQHHPDWPIIEGRCDGQGWSKGAAVADALTRTTAEILVVIDADLWIDNLPDAVAAVEAGAGWVMPQKLVHRLHPRATAAVLAGGPFVSKPQTWVQKPYSCVEGGGVVVLRRETYQQVPIDPRFVGWGGEDISWGWALRTLIGAPIRLDGDLWHLWHEPQARRNRRRGSEASEALAGRYRRALRQPDAMRALLDETRVAV